jgi:hypothetical protein
MPSALKEQVATSRDDPPDYPPIGRYRIQDFIIGGFACNLDPGFAVSTLFDSNDINMRFAQHGEHIVAMREFDP